MDYIPEIKSLMDKILSDDETAIGDVKLTPNRSITINGEHHVIVIYANGPITITGGGVTHPSLRAPDDLRG